MATDTLHLINSTLDTMPLAIAVALKLNLDEPLSTDTVLRLVTLAEAPVDDAPIMAAVGYVYTVSEYDGIIDYLRVDREGTLKYQTGLAGLFNPMDYDPVEVTPSTDTASITVIPDAAVAGYVPVGTEWPIRSIRNLRYWYEQVSGALPPGEYPMTVIVDRPGCEAGRYQLFRVESDAEHFYFMVTSSDREWLIRRIAASHEAKWC